MQQSYAQLQGAIEAYVNDQDKSICRLFHGRGKLYPGLEWLNVDAFNNVILCICYQAPDAEFLHWLSQQVYWCESRGHQLLLQHRHSLGAPLQAMGQATLSQVEWVRQAGLKYQLRFSGQNLGLFLDMELARAWLRERAHNRKVLNLFAYTCAFSVVAMAGGATQCINVDMSRAALSWGRENHRANNVCCDHVQFLGVDILKSWGKLTRLGPYQIVVVDPPSFQRGSFVATRDYHKIIKRLPNLTAPGADVLLCLNAPEIPTSFLTDLMAEHCPQFEWRARLGLPEVFQDQEPERQLKIMHFTKSEAIE